jgi:hypothetical protein
MTKELEMRIANKYPKLCADYLNEEAETPFYSFEFGDGWFDLIDNTLAEVNELCEKSNFEVKIDQAKSKFNELRLYFSIAPNQKGVRIQQAIAQLDSIVEKAIANSRLIKENI